MTTTRSYTIKPAQTYTMPGVRDERRALIDEISAMYRRYFQREVRQALTAAWVEKSPAELRHIRDCWTKVKGQAPTITAQPILRTPVAMGLFE